MYEPTDIHQIPYKKLHDIFGADTALYINIQDYGNKYYIIASSTKVDADAKLIDLRNGKVLWGASVQVTKDNRSGNSDVVGVLVDAAIGQVFNSLRDQEHVVAGMASKKLLTAGSNVGLLYGPYSSQYHKNNAFFS